MVVVLKCYNVVRLMFGRRSQYVSLMYLFRYLVIVVLTIVVKLVLFLEQMIQWVLVSVVVLQHWQIAVVVFFGYRMCRFC